MECRYRRVEDADGTLAKLQVFRWRAGIILQAQANISKCSAHRTADVFRTHRCQEDESLLEVAETFYLLVSNTVGHIFDERVEVLERFLAEDGFDDVFVDLLAGVIAESTLLGSGGDGGE